MLNRNRSAWLSGIELRRELDCDQALEIESTHFKTLLCKAKVLGKKKDYYGVGLWTLTSFVNHSCIPNARRLPPHWRLRHCSRLKRHQGPGRDHFCLLRRAFFSVGKAERAVDASLRVSCLLPTKRLERGVEEGMKRASYLGVYEEIYNSERLMRRFQQWKLWSLEGMKKKNGGCCSNIAEMERILKLGKGVYGKVVSKKKAMKTLLGL